MHLRGKKDCMALAKIKIGGGGIKKGYKIDSFCKKKIPY